VPHQHIATAAPLPAAGKTLAPGSPAPAALRRTWRQSSGFAGWLQHHRVASLPARLPHPRQDGQRKVPRRNHHTHAERNVIISPCSPGNCTTGCGAARRSISRRVVFRRSRSPRIHRLRPPARSCRLRRPATLDSSLRRRRCARPRTSCRCARGRHAAPFREILPGGLDGAGGQHGVRPMVYAHDFAWVRRIHRFEPVAGRDVFAPMRSRYSRPNSERTAAGLPPWRAVGGLGEYDVSLRNSIQSSGTMFFMVQKHRRKSIRPEPWYNPV